MIHAVGLGSALSVLSLEGFCHSSKSAACAWELLLSEKDDLEIDFPEGIKLGPAADGCAQ